MIEQTIHHVYSLDNKVIEYNLSEEQLEEKIRNGIINVDKHEIVKLQIENYREASY